jgi:uncharacterized protein (TIGR04255 family)
LNTVPICLVNELNPLNVAQLMATDNSFPHLANAPIVEAVIELRLGPGVQGPAETRQALGEITKQLGDDYPKSLKLSKLGFSLKIEDQAEDDYFKKSEEFDGFRLLSADENYRVQVRPRAFSAHRMAPYTSWEDLKSRFDDAWKCYQAVMQPSSISRIGVRFINRFTLPVGREVTEYLAPLLVRPVLWPANMAAYEMTLVLLEDKAQATVKTALQTVGENESRVLIDIDAFIQQEGPVDVVLIGGTLLKLRELKNRVFFGAISDKCLKLFS